MEYRDGIKSKGDKIMTACTHSTVIADARNSQAKRINASPILSQRHTAESRIDVYYAYMEYTMFMLCGGYSFQHAVVVKFHRNDRLMRQYRACGIDSFRLGITCICYHCTMCTSRHDLVSFAFYAIPIFPF